MGHLPFFEPQLAGFLSNHPVSVPCTSLLAFPAIPRVPLVPRGRLHIQLTVPPPVFPAAKHLGQASQWPRSSDEPAPPSVEPASLGRSPPSRLEIERLFLPGMLECLGGVRPPLRLLMKFRSCPGAVSFARPWMFFPKHDISSFLLVDFSACTKFLFPFGKGYRPAGGLLSFLEAASLIFSFLSLLSSAVSWSSRFSLPFRAVPVCPTSWEAGEIFVGGGLFPCQSSLPSCILPQAVSSQARRGQYRPFCGGSLGSFSGRPFSLFLFENFVLDKVLCWGSGPT